VRIANPRFSWLRLVALMAALAAMCFLASGATFWHSDAHGSDATCPTCHVAHAPALQLVPMALEAAPRAIAWVIPSVARPAHSESFSLIPPARAPPA